MMSHLEIQGIIPIVPTPFNKEEEIAWDDLRALIDFAAFAGACAACLPAYASEFYKLSDEERYQIVSEAVGHSAGRIPIIGQVNHASALRAIDMARKMQQCGASALCIAVPRLFPLTEHDLLRYFARVLDAISTVVIIQDFNPGGVCLSTQWIDRLHRQYPHFRYVKLEEPLMSGKVRSIREATNGGVGVITGWGGMYTIELIPAGICGVMPGLALTDVLALVFRHAVTGERHEAFRLFQRVLPQIVFSLQNIELFHHAEKLLLQARGILRETNVRDAGLELNESDKAHIEFLNTGILALLEEVGLPANPMAAARTAEKARQ